MFADGKISLAVIYGHFFPGLHPGTAGQATDQDWGIVQLWTNLSTHATRHPSIFETLLEVTNALNSQRTSKACGG